MCLHAEGLHNKRPTAEKIFSCLKYPLAFSNCRRVDKTQYGKDRIYPNCESLLTYGEKLADLVFAEVSRLYMFANKLGLHLNSKIVLCNY